MNGMGMDGKKMKAPRMKKPSDMPMGMDNSMSEMMKNGGSMDMHKMKSMMHKWASALLS